MARTIEPGPSAELLHDFWATADQYPMPRGIVIDICTAMLKHFSKEEQAELLQATASLLEIDNKRSRRRSERTN